jgi:O-succinylbenzoate synthase
MAYNFSYTPYRHPFTLPLHTNHGVWQEREGIIVTLEKSNKIGKGEIAPLPWFGSETLASAIAFCDSLPSNIDKTIISNIPDSLPCCQFALESALEDLLAPEDEFWPNLSFSYLLPAGEAALSVNKEGKKTFKWKIAVGTISSELKIFEKLLTVLPSGAKLRLDANEGLSFQQAKIWLDAAEGSELVEFIEQPLPKEQFDLMLQLSQNYSIPLALDESVANLHQLQDCYQREWRGIFVIKPAIAGSPQLLRQLCDELELDLVFSSVFETAIGRKSALRLASQCCHNNRAVGFGVEVIG